MHAFYLKLKTDLAVWRSQVYQTHSGLLLISRSHIRIVLQTKGNDFSACIQGLPVASKSIVCIDDSNPALLQTGKYLTLGTGNVFARTQLADMRSVCVVDYRYIRLGDVCQVIDLAQVVHAHFGHYILMSSFNLE